MVYVGSLQTATHSSGR